MYQHFISNVKNVIDLHPKIDKCGRKNITKFAVSKCKFWVNENGIIFSEDFSTNSRSNVKLWHIQFVFTFPKYVELLLNFFMISIFSTKHQILTFSANQTHFQNQISFNEKCKRKKHQNNISDSYSSISAQF